MPRIRSSPPLTGRDRGDHPHRRGLAGAVGPEEAERLTAADVDVDALDRLEVAELLAQPARADHRRPDHRAVPVATATMNDHRQPSTLITVVPWRAPTATLVSRSSSRAIGFRARSAVVARSARSPAPRRVAGRRRSIPRPHARMAKPLPAIALGALADARQVDPEDVVRDPRSTSTCRADVADAGWVPARTEVFGDVRPSRTIIVDRRAASTARWLCELELDARRCDARPTTCAREPGASYDNSSRSQPYLTATGVSAVRALLTALEACAAASCRQVRRTCGRSCRAGAARACRARCRRRGRVVWLVARQRVRRGSSDLVGSTSRHEHRAATSRYLQRSTPAAACSTSTPWMVHSSPRRRTSRSAASRPE